jgi:hypothetical protein
MTTPSIASQPIGIRPTRNAPVLLRGLAVAAICALAFAGGQGVPPRSKPADYPVHQSAKNGAATATIAAAIVPSDQVRKMFSSDIASNYVVVEVAIYPDDGQSFEADRYDFSLKTGDKIAHADAPPDVALPWGEKKNPLDSKVHVTEDAGVVYSRSNDPYYGKRQGVGTYESTTVSDVPPPQQPQSGPDPRVVEAKLRDKALPEGRTADRVAGYLYFPQYSRKKRGDAVELEYAKQDVEVDLRFPAK